MFSIPDLPVLLPHAKGALRLSMDGEVEELPGKSARNLAAREPHILCHKPSVIRHLGGGKSWTPHPQSADVLELFAFVFPARFCAPSPGGLALALELPLPQDAQQSALLIYRAASEMLERLADAPTSDSRIAIARIMQEAGWGWGESVLAALGDPAPPRNINRSLEIWNGLSEWKEIPPRSTKSERPVEAGEASRRLKQLLGSTRKPRIGQFDYAEGAADAFAPRKDHGAARIVLAEAGTGIGKTLGYLAAADIWSQRNKSSVWISTYTKNLQHQLQRETCVLLPDAPAATEHKSAAPERKTEVVLRKGRANYLCLLRLEEWLKRTAFDPQRRIQAGLIALWAERSADGAVIGGDFPNWLMSDSNAPTDDIRDRNRECIHAACPHYRKCFAENVARQARKASLVLANHALVMTSLARQPHGMDVKNDRKDGNGEDKTGSVFPARFVFDEGQHLFDVADGVFSLHCNGTTMARLRYWLVGTEGRGARGGGVKGLRARVFSCVENVEEVEIPLEEINNCARFLPAPGWRTRLQKGTPRRESEAFLHQVREMILARSPEDGGFYNLDVPCRNLPDSLLSSMRSLNKSMGKLQEFLERLLAVLEIQDRGSAALETLIGAIRRRALTDLEEWRVMLAHPILAQESDAQEDKRLDLFALERSEGREIDVGMHRHWIDPTGPFARQLLEPCQGALITSATLHDGAKHDAHQDRQDCFYWKIAEMRTGAAHLPLPARRFSIASPFDYKNQTRIYLIEDIADGDGEAIAQAYGDLFLAAGGGALGLFTSIARLRQTYKSVAPRLQSAGIETFAQHVDAMDNSTLMNIFRMLESSCLLGCDAVRDGVDVPGRGLRLVVLDKPPWPRVDVLHKARRLHFGGREYDMMLTRFRLRQAFGRLIRAEEDRGVFILLTNRIPASLHAAFPQEVAVEILPLAAAIRKSAAFLQIDNSLPA